MAYKLKFPARFVVGVIDGEIWKDIDNYIGHYQVSNYGRIKSLSRKGSPREMILSDANCDGYRVVALKKDDKLKTFRVHRLVAIAFVYNPENKPEINHKNGVRHDNKADNLEWVTHQENIQHAFDIGIKSQIGSKCPRAILNENQVLDIRKKHIKGMVGSRSKLANEYGVSIPTIKKILNRTNWSHI